MADSVSAATCPLCEATCGLEVTVDAGRVTKLRGDADDVFSRGFICPKGGTLTVLHEDPDRLRAPLVKQADGTFATVTWDEAFAQIERRLPPLIAEHGRDSVAAYLGNPGRAQPLLPRLRTGAAQGAGDEEHHIGLDGRPVPPSSWPPGVNSNILADELQIEPLSGTAVLNGLPVDVAPAGVPVEA